MYDNNNIKIKIIVFNIINNISIAHTQLKTIIAV